MSFDPCQPYGPVVATSCRIATWNVWGRFGDWEARQEGLCGELAAQRPDVVCLQESWETDTGRQVDGLGDALELGHRFSEADWSQDGWRSGAAVLSRWPITHTESRALPGDGDAPGRAMYILVDGPRGPLQLFNVWLDHPLHGSGVRQSQVRQLAGFVADVQERRHLTVLCGDFNAAPDADEIRLLNGRSRPPVDGLVFYDAWETAGDGPGITWANANPLAALSLLPDRRIDYIFSAWPRRGGVGHPLGCRLMGTDRSDGVDLSDHYGLVAELRY